MQRLQAFKYELMPNGQQERQMRRFAGACRFVYNKALALQKANHEAGGKYIGYVAMARLLTEWRNSTETAWLKEAPVHPLQQALKDLERAYQNFFAKRAAFPRFKRRGDRQSFRYPDPKQIKLDGGNARIFLPKLGWLRLRLSRPMLGVIRNATVSERAGRWYVSVQTEQEVQEPVPVATTAVGIDMGVARFATLSDGSYIEPLASFRRHEQRLARYQRCMSRKVKGSRNWHKAKARCAAPAQQDCQCASGLPAPGQQPHCRRSRDGRARRPAGQEHEPLSRWHAGGAWAQRAGQGWAEQSHPGSGMV